LKGLHLAFLEKYIASKKNSKITLKLLMYELLNKFPELKKISIRCLYLTLRNRMHYSNKRICKKAVHYFKRSNYHQRVFTCCLLGNLFMNKKRIISIDEAGFQISKSHNYSWGKTNEKIIQATNCERQNYSLLAAISEYGVEGFLIKKGGINRYDFVYFMKELVCVLDNFHRNFYEDFWFFFDNCSCHRSKHSLEKLKQLKINVLFNAVYASELNPIELFFNSLKTKVFTGYLQNR